MNRRHRAVGLLLGVALDQVLGDPRRGHPVAAFGTAAARLERRTYADRRVRGVAHVALCVGAVAVGGGLLERASGRGRWAVVAAATWAVLGGRSLGAEASAVATLVDAGELAKARKRLTHLVGRETAGLDESEVSRAVIESVAENTCDAVVAPLVWGALLGVPGLLGFRAVNTLDAMIGHHSPRYENFGWAAARLDDVANWVPARLTAALVAACAPLVGGSPHHTLETVRFWGQAHPSPNSGMSEAAFAGALGIRLGGRNVYATRVEDRPVLGDGRPPTRADVPSANRLLQAVTAGAALVAAGLAVVSGRSAG